MKPRLVDRRRFIAASGSALATLPLAAAWLQEGHFGKPLWAHIVWFEHRPPVDKCAPFTPDWVDFDLWCGLAPGAGNSSRTVRVPCLTPPTRRKQ